jgi:hypothetical protein
MYVAFVSFRVSISPSLGNSPQSLLPLLCGTSFWRLGLLAWYLSRRIFHCAHTTPDPGYFPTCDGRGMARWAWDEFFLPPLGLAIAHRRDGT